MCGASYINLQVAFEKLLHINPVFYILIFPFSVSMPKKKHVFALVPAWESS
jgi:hypothetical protein